MIAALYARVSTAKQEEQETIDSQVNEIRARIATDGHVLPEENVFQDDGWTGEMLVRPGLDLMRDAANEGKFEILYVYDRGRLSRVFAYQEIIIEEITNKGIEFVTMHDMQAKTPEEHVLQAMQGVFHEYERVKIVERFRRGKLHKARSGHLINGQAPYGLTYILKQGNESAKMLVNEEEAKVVNKVFRWLVIDRLPVRGIRRKMYELGYKPKKGKKDYWGGGAICRLLRNRVYMDGLVYYNKTEAIVAKKSLKPVKYKKIKRTSRRVREKSEWIPYQVPVILEEPWMFEEAQIILSMNKTFASKNRKYDYLLSGLVWCECGSKRAGDGCNANNHYYYRCAEKLYKFPLEGKCTAHGVNAMVLDGLTWRNLRNFLSDKDMLKRQAEKWLSKQAVQGDAWLVEKLNLEKQLNGIKEEEMKYAKAFGAGVLDFEQLQQLAKEQKSKKAGFEARLKELEEKHDDQVLVRPEDTDRLVNMAEMVLKDMLLENRKQIIRDLVDKITVYEGGDIELTGHLPQFDQKLGYFHGDRDCGVAECGEVHVV
ncbi:hypothetical protein A2876_04615 [Candidatus Amesbacteria bacterium RIFCSPHIGHO2_01_FULL_48_32b]|uniref:Resolvase/invertase-type recombinase catalytic domain-containing protein n=1 Tax=Candidatus Amesbacteria bacterium RIFCSPHIGHO2_01_FULL_48_32b TaxID=1797253 RepID=A0A1F4YCX2_9BACT|nr:MAG: hypothetical protein A2876_04615 [Candidatus Amesbacteria bacterium RIFCSPHIGHO2_01_FULL_48_32b]